VLLQEKARLFRPEGNQLREEKLYQQPPSRTAEDAQQQAMEMTTTDFSSSGCRAAAFLPLLAASLALSSVY
jgi:hypothetical protein